MDRGTGGCIAARQGFEPAARLGEPRRGDRKLGEIGPARVNLKNSSDTASSVKVGGLTTIRDARAEIGELLRDSPSLRRHIDGMLAEQINIAAQLAEDDLARHGETMDKIRTRLEGGGFTAEQVLGDWFPDPPG